MDLEELASRLEAWYEVERGALGLPSRDTAHIANPTLRRFYERLGKLPERDGSFTHPSSHLEVLAAQDKVLACSDLRKRAASTVFAFENQGNFAVAAADDPHIGNVLSDASYIAVDPKRYKPSVDDLDDMGIPLEEAIVSLVLRETIMSVEDRYALISPDTWAQAREAASKGRHYSGRYIFDDHYWDFWLSEEVWYMEGESIPWAAHKGIWRKPRSDDQQMIIPDGGYWSR